MFEARRTQRRCKHLVWLWMIILVRIGVLQAEPVAIQPYRGVTYIVRKEAAPWPVSMHILLIDLKDPGIRFKLTPAGGTRETIRQTTLDFLNQEHAQLAIAAHFFLPFPSLDTNVNVVGFAASEGVIYSPFEPQPIGTDYVDQSYAILPYAPAMNIDPSNHVEIVHQDPNYPDNRHVLENVTLWNALSGSAQFISNGVVTIPAYSGSPDGLNALYGYSDEVSWYHVPRARTAAGVTEDGQTLVLFTVDEESASFGMTVDEMADLLIRDYHVYNALNLDGGGSTSMALQDPVTHVGHLVNASSDNPSGRATGSNLAIFAANSDTYVALNLTITASNFIVVSWPASTAGWRLQEKTGLDGADWANVCLVPRCIGDRMEVDLRSEAASRFYRLAK